MVKKISALFLALVLCLTAMVVPVSAAGAASASIRFEFLDENGDVLEAVNPGQTITVNIYATVDAAGEALSAAKFQIWFNSAQYECVSYDWVGPKAYLKADSISSVITSGTVFNNVKNKMTAEEQAYGWDSALYMQFNLDGTVEGQYLIKENEATPFATAKFKLKDTVAIGTVAPIGAPLSSIWAKSRATYNYVQTTNIKAPSSTDGVNLDTGAGTSFVTKVPKCAECTWDDGVINPAPTCVDTGVKTFTCTVCGETKTETVNATGVHTPKEAEDENVVPASCNTAGSKDVVVYCSVCDGELSRTPTTIPATGDHNYATEVEREDADCENDGYYVMACGCGAKADAVTIPATGHDMQESAAKEEATCGADGKEAVYTCANGCGKTEGGAVIPATGNHNYTTEAERVEADCENDGYYVMACACGAKEDAVTLPATGHDMKESAAKVEADCENDGKEAVYTCANGCGKTEGGAVIPATDHDYKESFKRVPNCYTDGYIQYTCEKCKDSYKDPLAKYDHKYEDGSSAVKPIEDSKEATCTEPGYKGGTKCELCDNNVEPVEELPALGHTETDPVEEIIKAATCTEAGSKTITVYCSVCEEIVSQRTERIEPGHVDADENGKCDSCGEVTGSGSGSGSDSGSDSGSSDECDHACHKDGIVGFFWKIVRFFFRLLNIQQYCDCGELHYEEPIINFNR